MLQTAQRFFALIPAAREQAMWSHRDAARGDYLRICHKAYGNLTNADRIEENREFVRDCAVACYDCGELSLIPLKAIAERTERLSYFENFLLSPGRRRLVEEFELALTLMSNAATEPMLVGHEDFKYVRWRMESHPERIQDALDRLRVWGRSDLSDQFSHLLKYASRTGV